MSIINGIKQLFSKKPESKFKKYFRQNKYSNCLRTNKVKIPKQHYEEIIKITKDTKVRLEPYAVHRNSKVYYGYNISNLDSSIFQKDYTSIKKSLGNYKVKKGCNPPLLRDEYEATVKGVEHAAKLGGKQIFVKPRHKFIRKWLEVFLSDWLERGRLSCGEHYKLHMQLLGLINSNNLTIETVNRKYPERKKENKDSTHYVFMMIEFPKIFYRDILPKKTLQ